MKRGDVYFADLDPTVGDETKKKQPVLIISNNANNAMANTVTVVPLTSVVSKVYPFEVLLNKQDSGLKKSSKAQCHQVRTISKMRIQGGKAGSLSQDAMLHIVVAIKLHLDIC